MLSVLQNRATSQIFCYTSSIRVSKDEHWNNYSNVIRSSLTVFSLLLLQQLQKKQFIKMHGLIRDSLTIGSCTFCKMHEIHPQKSKHFQLDLCKMCAWTHSSWGYRRQSVWQMYLKYLFVVKVCVWCTKE